MISKKNVYLLILLLGVSFSCSKKADIIIGSKSFTEGIILAEIMDVLIQEKTGLSVEVKQNLGSTFILLKSLEAGNIDMYAEYTGTLYQTKLKKTKRVTAAESYKIVKSYLFDKHRWIVFEPFGFSNAYAIGMLKEKAQALNIHKISDLQKHPNLIAGFDSEFIARSDGGKAMLVFYNIQPNHSILSLEVGLRYQAIKEKRADYTDVYSTDSKLRRFDMAVLKDDKNFFSPYQAVPLVRKEIIDKYPEIESVLPLLKNSIDQKTMIDLNYQVEENKRDPKEVAREFLKRNGIL